MAQVNLDQLLTVRLRTFAMIQDFSQEQLDYVPEPGAWSISEMVAHLILSEQFLRGKIAILIEQAEGRPGPVSLSLVRRVQCAPRLYPGVDPAMARSAPQCLQCVYTSEHSRVCRAERSPFRHRRRMSPCHAEAKRRLYSAKNCVPYCTQRRPCLRPTRRSTMITCGTNTRYLYNVTFVF